MEEVAKVTQAFVQFLGLDPALIPTAIVLAIILRFARAMTHWVGEGWTLVAALVLAAAGAVVKAAEHQPWRVDVSNGLALLAAILILQGVLKMAADSGPLTKFLPSDKQWASAPTDTTKP